MVCGSTSLCQNSINKSCKDITLAVNDGYGILYGYTSFEIYQGPIDIVTGNVQLQFNYYIGDDVYYQQVYLNINTNKSANMPLLVGDDYLCIELTNLTINSASYTVRYAGTSQICGLECGIITVAVTLGILGGLGYILLKNRREKEQKEKEQQMMFMM